MSPLSEVGLVAGREIKKNFRSVKGVILLVLSLLGAGCAALVLSWARKSTLAQGLSDPETMKMAFQKFLSADEWYGPGDTATYLADSPPMLYWIMWTTVWLTPLMMAVLGFDGVAGELQNRTVRYWNVRSRRWAYYAGKVVGLWGVVAAFTLMVHVSVWVVGVSFGIAPAGQVLRWGLRFYAITIPISGAWCGISTLVSSNFRVPILALLTTCGVFFALWMLKGVGMASESLAHLRYLYPNTYDEWLLSPKPQRVLQGVAVLAGFMALSTSLGSFIFEKRDV